MGFVFYDVETTGTHTQFDQILQFAAIHTDYELNELERFERRCRLIPHVVPSPVLAPDVLQVPFGGNGRPSFKLDRLAPANGFEHANAHDALADVEATIHICRLIRERAPDLWSNALRFAQKRSALEFMDEAPAFAITECYFGRAYQYALTKLGIDASNNSSVITYDLHVDPSGLRMLSDEALAQRLAMQIKPVRRVRANAAPLLHDIYDFAEFGGLTPDQLTARAVAIQGDTDFCARLITAAARAPSEASPYIEGRIYEGFSAPADRARMAAFHERDWDARAAIISSFEDLRLTELGERLIFYHAPHCLSHEARVRVERALAQRALGIGVNAPPWLTLIAAQVEIEELVEECDDAEFAIIHSLRDHVAREIARCTALLE